MMAAPVGTDINRAAELLRAGKLVGMPTETVYGLAANALDATAVTAVFEAKNRPSFDPLIVHLPDWSLVPPYVLEVPPLANRLADAFLPGPLTILLTKNARISDLVTAGLPRVAIRIPAHPVARQLLRTLHFPVVAPSANPFGYVSPTTAQHVVDQLGDKITYVLDGGPCVVGLESTIIGFEDGGPVVYRKGGVAVEAIEDLLARKVAVRTHSSSNPTTPGQLMSHYAPGRRVQLFRRDRPLPEIDVASSGALCWREPLPGIAAARQYLLSPEGDLSEAARRLFAGLRQLDIPEIETIYAELVPEHGLGRAINDRLRRAAAS